MRLLNVAKGEEAKLPAPPWSPLAGDGLWNATELQGTKGNAHVGFLFRVLPQMQANKLYRKKWLFPLNPNNTLKKKGLEMRKMHDQTLCFSVSSLRAIEFSHSQWVKLKETPSAHATSFITADHKQAIPNVGSSDHQNHWLLSRFVEAKLDTVWPHILLPLFTLQLPSFSF